MLHKFILFVAAILFFSACSTKFGLTKRRYTKGYYVSSSKALSSRSRQTLTAKATPDRLETLTVSASEVVTEHAEASEVPLVPSTHHLITPERTVKQVSEKRHVNVLPSLTSRSQIKDPFVFKPLDIKPRQKNPAQTRNDDNARLIIMVVLCFFWFINLIPVYMHDGAVTTNFWITLVLDLLLIVGVVFALLVVLDIVDLSKT